MGPCRASGPGDTGALGALLTAAFRPATIRAVEARDDSACQHHIETAPQNNNLCTLLPYCSFLPPKMSLNRKYAALPDLVSPIASSLFAMHHKLMKLLGLCARHLRDARAHRRHFYSACTYRRVLSLPSPRWLSPDCRQHYVPPQTTNSTMTRRTASESRDPNYG